MAQPDDAFMRRIEEIIRRNHHLRDQMLTAMQQRQAFINAQNAYFQNHNLQNQLGAQPHGRHWPSPQTLHGNSSGASGSRTGGGAGGPATSSTAIRAHESAPPTIEEAGVRAGEIIAWRVWRLEPRKELQFKQSLRSLPYISRKRLAPVKYEQEIVPATPLLHSTYKSTIWEPGKVMEAHGDPAEQQYSTDARAASNFVGIFAWKTMARLCKYAQLLGYDDVFGIRSPPSIAIGQIALWGSVVEHELGYRAQFAKPHRIFMVSDYQGDHSNESLRVELCKLYGLPEEGV